ncbi:virulence RhuM family protein [Fusibacter paucivorans]|uniref:Virulence RhuM family protein n=1 Tax=Fusibacter paucivorans TaxID=76009 RepID=A0ABS5PUQ5_9FIRM|nr:virulence RhuM family protein [Fusibacter paucivorans]
MENNNDLLIYQTEDGKTKIDVRLENETVWMTQKAIAELYQTTPQNKLHFAIHSHTAAELIEQRADASKDNIGLTTWKGEKKSSMPSSNLMSVTFLLVQVLFHMK